MWKLTKLVPHSGSAICPDGRETQQRRASGPYTVKMLARIVHSVVMRDCNVRPKALVALLQTYQGKTVTGKLAARVRGSVLDTIAKRSQDSLRSLPPLADELRRLGHSVEILKLNAGQMKAVVVGKAKSEWDFSQKGKPKHEIIKFNPETVLWTGDPNALYFYGILYAPLTAKAM